MYPNVELEGGVRERKRAGDRAALGDLWKQAAHIIVFGFSIPDCVSPKNMRHSAMSLWYHCHINGSSMFSLITPNIWSKYKTSRCPQKNVIYTQFFKVVMLHLVISFLQKAHSAFFELVFIFFRDKSHWIVEVPHFVCFSTVLFSLLLYPMYFLILTLNIWRQSQGRQS